VAVVYLHADVRAVKWDVPRRAGGGRDEARAFSYGVVDRGEDFPSPTFSKSVGKWVSMEVTGVVDGSTRAWTRRAEVRINCAGPPAYARGSGIQSHVVFGRETQGLQARGKSRLANRSRWAISFATSDGISIDGSHSHRQHGRLPPRGWRKASPCRSRKETRHQIGMKGRLLVRDRSRCSRVRLEFQGLDKVGAFKF